MTSEHIVIAQMRARARQHEALALRWLQLASALEQQSVAVVRSPQASPMGATAPDRWNGGPADRREGG